jgi:L-ascorbate metabolism protein UlaG (beta-lactamase superfamily)
MKIQYLGHASFLVTTAKAKILIDPFLTGNPMAATTAEKVAADLILVSHGHGDHYGDAVAIAKRTGATIVAPYELALHAGAQGAKVHPMGCGGGKDFAFGRVQLTIAHHSSSVEEAGKAVSIAAPVGFLIQADGKTIYFAGDTALTMDMELLGRRNSIDLALLKAKRAVPMHYNTFEMIEVDPGIFQKEAEKSGCKVDVLKPGESIEI